MSMARARYYILDDNKLAIPVFDLMEWAMHIETSLESRRVAWTAGDDYHVSTVFLGLDHNYTLHGEPLLFETMVFLASGETGQMDRYASWAEAAAGHERICSILAMQNKIALDTVHALLRRQQTQTETVK